MLAPCRGANKGALVHFLAASGPLQLEARSLGSKLLYSSLSVVFKIGSSPWSWASGLPGGPGETSRGVCWSQRAPARWAGAEAGLHSGQ